jgi:hypothetical protein
MADRDRLANRSEALMRSRPEQLAAAEVIRVSSIVHIDAPSEVTFRHLCDPGASSQGRSGDGGWSKPIRISAPGRGWTSCRHSTRSALWSFRCSASSFQSRRHARSCRASWSDSGAAALTSGAPRRGSKGASPHRYVGWQGPRGISQVARADLSCARIGRLSRGPRRRRRHQAGPGPEIRAKHVRRFVPR